MTSVQRISSPVDLTTFVASACYNPAMASSVRELAIDIDGPFPIDTLRLCLSLTRHITDLSLVLAADIPVHLLVGIRLRRLEFLNTNLPHRHLIDFLHLNSNISELCLGLCLRDVEGTCPLRALAHRSYLSVECPVDCAAEVAHGGLVRLAMAEMRVDHPGTSTVLRGLRPPLVSLLYLTMDFAPDDYDILETIIPVAPMLRKLKLLEKPRVYRRQLQARRAWKDAASWSRNLAKLGTLEDLSLRTASAITEAVPSLADEWKVLIRWVTAPQAVNTLQPLLEHRSLSSLRLWYQSLDANNGVITIWSKYTGSWANIHRTVGPPHGALF